MTPVSAQRSVRRHRVGPARRGFALVAVLWVLVVVGLLATEFHMLARGDRRVAANMRAAARARWAARGALARALDGIDRAVRANQLAPAGDTLLVPLRITVGGVPTTAVVLDARARLHLNRATPAELREFLDASGMSLPAADSLASAIVDWRDEDAFRSPRGAEAADYAVSASGTPPPDAPLERVAGLQGVRGLTADLYGRIAERLTVAGDGRVNVNSASLPVLRTIPGMDETAAAIVVTRRRVSPYRNVFDLIGSLPRPTQERMRARMPALLEHVAFTPRDVLVFITAGAGGGAGNTSSIEATVSISGTSVTLVGAIER